MSKDNRVSDERLAEMQKDCGIANPPTQETYWFRKALAGEGPHAYDWSDKPHRIVFDLCNIIEAASALRSKPVEVEVKGLDWHVDKFGRSADSVFGTWWVRNPFSDGRVQLEGPFGHSMHANADAAVAAAEANYRQRILSALSLPEQEPDHVYDPNDWEYTLPWDDREQLIEEWQPNEVHKVATLVNGPDKWIVWLEANGDYDAHWFDSEAEANSALTAALKEA